MPAKHLNRQPIRRPGTQYVGELKQPDVVFKNSGAYFTFAPVSPIGKAWFALHLHYNVTDVDSVEVVIPYPYCNLLRNTMIESGLEVA